MGSSDTRFYEFGPFRLDAAEHIVLRDGQIIPLTPKVFETLLVLVENSGHVVDKDELLHKVWSDTFVEETNLTKNISILRKILSDGDAGKSFIETIPKRGYRFVAEVTKSVHEEEREQHPAKSSDSKLIKVLPAALPKSRKTDSGTHVIVNLADWRKLEGHTETKPERLPAAVSDADAEQLRVEPTNALQPTAETSGIYAPWYKRWPVIAVIAVFLMATVAGGLYWFRPDATAQPPEIRSLAVLPLRSLDPNDNALGFGIADALIRRISQTGEMTVRPASSVRQYLTEDTDAITAAKQLTVDAVLEGTIQRAGDRLRIGVNLLKADGTSLWTDSFDTQLTDVFAVQDTISQQVASRLKVRLNAGQQARLTKRSTSNPIAYEYYTRGVYSYDQREYGLDAKPQNDTTIDLFKKAVDTDPNYALAFASLADAYAFQAVHIDPGEQEKWIALANDAINRAETIDPQLPETHLARSNVLFSYLSGYQAAAAIREILAAQRLDPNIGHHDLAGHYNHIGLEDLAEGAFGRAFEIDPTSKIVARDYRAYYMLLHRPDEYLSAHQKYYAGKPISPLYYMMKGDLVTAKQRIDEDAAKNENRPNLFLTSFLLALKGEKKRSEELLAKEISDIDESFRRATSYHHFTYEVACIYAINGNVPEAMKWLRDSAEKGNPSYTLLARDPFLDKIRQSPEFIEFMAELKLEYDKYRSEFH